MMSSRSPDAADEQERTSGGQSVNTKADIVLPGFLCTEKLACQFAPRKKRSLHAWLSCWTESPCQPLSRCCDSSNDVAG